MADDPPATLVDRMAQTFPKTDGDIRAVMQTMLDSKEFWSEGAYRSKMKSPLEMVASAVRAVNGDVDFATALVNQVAQLGEPLYRKLEPTGYSNSSAEWMNTAGLVARMNFALQLASNKVPGVKVDANRRTELRASPWGRRSFRSVRRIAGNDAIVAYFSSQFGIWRWWEWVPRRCGLKRALYAADAPSAAQEDPGGHLPARRRRRTERRGAARREGLLRPAPDHRGPAAFQRRTARTPPSTWMASSACIPRSRL